MYFSDPKKQAKFDARCSQTGVLVEDDNGKLCQEIRRSLRQGDVLILRKKRKFILPVDPPPK